MTAQIKVQGLNGYQYNATVEIAGSAGGVSAGDIGAGLIIQQVTGSGSAKDIDKGGSKTEKPKGKENSKPSNKPYKNNKEANKQAQKHGYKDAHDLKKRLCWKR